MSLQGGGSHSTGLGRFSGAAYYQAAGQTFPTSNMVDAAFAPADLIYDTDNYLQGTELTAPFNGYYRVTGLYGSNDAVVTDYACGLVLPSLTQSVFDRGTATDGIGDIMILTTPATTGQVFTIRFRQESGVNRLMYIGGLVEYLGPA